MMVGGPAGEFYEPSTEQDFLSCVGRLSDEGKPYFILGNGTNVIVRDGGYPGAVISTLKAFRGIEVEGTRIRCGTGESLARVCRYAADNGLTGLEELSGIPGTVGGAIYMNAGAYEREIASILVLVRVYDENSKNIIMLTNVDCEFNYRSSVFKDKSMIILSAEFVLTVGNKNEIEKRVLDLTYLRNKRQPVELPSAGSFFKRPEGNFAGKLIEKAGMKGVCVGGAKVSEKHAGFIVNTGGATAADVLTLAEEIKEKVYKEFGIQLEEEPIVIGE